MLLAGTLATFFAVRASRLGGDLERAESERDSATAEREELLSKATALAESEQNLAATMARLEAIEAERDRLLVADEDKLYPRRTNTWGISGATSTRSSSRSCRSC